MESIDKLRKLGTKVKNSCFTGVHCDAVLDLADEIETEIAERYMLLPVDANGEPIHVGDVMTLRHEKTCEVVAVSETQFTGKKLGSENCVCNANLHRHVKPRTLEDVLVDMLETAVGYSDAHTDVSLVAVEKYADEIRELLGGDAE